MFTAQFVRMSNLKKTSEIPIRKLSKREDEILFFLAHGYSNDQIALILNISIRTVSTHRTNIMKKLKVHCLAKLIRVAYDQNLISL